MKNLCIDLGNTFSKIGYFDNQNLIEYFPNVKSETIINYCLGLDFDQLMICSVTKTVGDLEKEFAILKKPIHILLPDTPIPIKKNYETPETLGADRLAAAVGAATLFPNENSLIIDMGT